VDPLTGLAEPVAGASAGPARRSRTQQLKLQRAPAIFLAGTDEAISNRFHGALAKVARIRGEHPDWDDDRVARQLTDRYLAEVTVSGAAAGGAAALPGVGLATGIAATTADMAWYGWATARMVLGVAGAYRVDISHPQVRRAYVLGVLAADETAVALAAQVGSSIEAYGHHALTAVNSRLARVILLRLSTRLATSRALALIPVGIGAAAGAGVNYVLGRDIARRSVSMFRTLAAAGTPAADATSWPALTGAGRDTSPVVVRSPLPRSLRHLTPVPPHAADRPITSAGNGR